MKSGARALGVAESYADRGDEDASSVLCGAVVRVDRVADDFAFGACEVGGLDSTDAVRSLFSDLNREDVRYLLVSGVAPAWFNLFDLDALADAVDRPVISVSFEASSGLGPALREHFDGDALTERLAIYRSLPPRREVAVGDETVFARAVGIDPEETTDVVRAYTPEGGRPEPIRVARQAARGARRWRDEGL